MSAAALKVTTEARPSSRLAVTVVVQQLGVVRIKASALESLVDGAWREAIQQESLEPISQPELSGGFDGLLDSFQPR